MILKTRKINVTIILIIYLLRNFFLKPQIRRLVCI